MRKSFTQQQSKHSDHFNLFDSGLVLSSVELLPNASASAAFTVDSGHVFREDVDIVPVTLSNGIQYMPWGADNQLPYHVLDLIERDETLSTCQIFNAEVCYGNGLLYNTDLCSAAIRSAVDDFLLCNNMATYFLGVCQDFKHFGWCVSVIILDKEGKNIVSLHRKEVCYCRFTPANKHGVIENVLYGNWKKSLASVSDVEVIPLLSMECPWHDLQDRQKPMMSSRKSLTSGTLPRLLRMKQSLNGSQCTSNGCICVKNP